MLKGFSSSLQAFLGRFRKKNRLLKGYQHTLEAINQQEEDMHKSSDDDLRSKAVSLKERAINGEPLDRVLVPAFALIREVSLRQLGMRHFDVQMIGGMALHDGMIAEMKTGEGKTLVATLPTFLNGLKHPGIHIITVNDYLANRDAEWMGEIFRFLQWDVGCLIPGLSNDQKRKVYQSQVIYGTNNEFCFDHLRDHLQYEPSNVYQNAYHFAIVDEVDSILIDEARTPLIISGPSETPLEKYQAVEMIIAVLPKEAYDLDEKERTVTLTDNGNTTVEKALREKGILDAESVYDPANATVMNQVQQALKAHKLFRKDKDYVIRQEQVVIVDDFTGRMMPGRRYGDGLHQAIEAKEKVTIQKESVTLCSITFQNYFRFYKKLAGMTGTALTEEKEFQEIYGLSVLEISTHAPMIRDDREDIFYQTYQEKCEAICDVAQECYQRKQPLLVGTTSIEKSEKLSEMFHKKKLPHQVLNARHHEKESDIIASAGAPGALTIATNMAGRGTDIVLGGAKNDGSKKHDWEKRNEQVCRAGGLYVLGSERHESRRVDNQLRGRSGRQGDPGVSCFFLSLEDDLPRISGMAGISKALGGIVEKGEPLEHPMLTKAMERAQKQVEARNFQMRKTLLRYDDVIHHQRRIIYQEREDLLFGRSQVWEHFLTMRQDVLANMIDPILTDDLYPEQWDIKALEEQFFMLCGEHLPLEEWSLEEGINPEVMEEKMVSILEKKSHALLSMKERDKVLFALMLRCLDRCWRYHINTLEQLRQGVGLRGYGQRDPLQEFRLEAFALFEAFLENYHKDIVSTVLRIEHRPQSMTLTLPQGITTNQPDLTQNALFSKMLLQGSLLQGGLPRGALPQGALPGGLPQIQKGSSSPMASQMASPIFPISSPVAPLSSTKIGRNQPCPCGSGKKYKKCCGR